MEDAKKYAIGAGIAIITFFLLFGSNCNSGLAQGCGTRRTVVYTNSRSSVRIPTPRLPVPKFRIGRK